MCGRGCRSCVTQPATPLLSSCLLHWRSALSLDAGHDSPVPEMSSAFIRTHTHTHNHAHSLTHSTPEIRTHNPNLRQPQWTQLTRLIVGKFHKTKSKKGEWATCLTIKGCYYEGCCEQTIPLTLVVPAFLLIQCFGLWPNICPANQFANYTVAFGGSFIYLYFFYEGSEGGQHQTSTWSEG